MIYDAGNSFRRLLRRPLWAVGLIGLPLGVAGSIAHAGLPETIEIAPIADAYVDERFPEQEFGNAVDLYVGDANRNEPPIITRTYLRFDLSSVPDGAIIESADLYLAHWGVGAGSIVVGVYYVDNDTWGENTINWDNQPTGHSSSPTDTVAVGIDQYPYSWNLTSYVETVLEDDGILSVVMKEEIEGTDHNWAGFNSREDISGELPRLVIEYTPGGACCLDNGTCLDDVDYSSCFSQDGWWLGDGSTCGGPSRGCCLADDTCVTTGPACCDLWSGTSQQLFSTCGAEEACCLPDGSCTNMDPLCCDDIGGEPKGAGSTCLGDNDGDGLDDACFESACGDCGPGTHWIDTCSAGPDEMPTSALVGLDMDFDCVTDTSVILDGPVSIARTGALDDSSNFPGLATVDGHLDVIDTEIVFMSLTGGGATLTAGAGLGATPLDASLGAIVELSGDPTLGDSFFDVFFEVDLGGGALAYNQTALRLGSQIDCLPPDVVYVHAGGCTPLYDSPIPGVGVQVANLVSADHDTYPTPVPRGCCMPDGSCVQILPEECVAQGGIPQWSGSACSVPETCCLPDGSCIDVDPLCCDEHGGSLSPSGEPLCLGDGNGNTIDDACDRFGACCDWSSLICDDGVLEADCQGVADEWFEDTLCADLDPRCDVSGPQPMGTAFTYQGQLKDNDVPVNDTVDFEFTLWDSPSGGLQVGPTISINALEVVDGLFTVKLDFGAGAFTGDARWLEVAVRSPAGSGDFTTLGSRQGLTPTPYAIYAETGGDGSGGGGIDGSGTPDYVAKFVDGTTIGDSVIYESAGNVGIGTPSPDTTLEVSGMDNESIRVTNTSLSGRWIEMLYSTGVGPLLRGGSGYGKLTLDANSGGGPGEIQLGLGGDKVGIGTPTPDAELEVNGQVKITGGSPGTGKVLTSDSTGLATWQIPSAMLVPSYHSIDGLTCSDPQHKAYGNKFYWIYIDHGLKDGESICMRYGLECAEVVKCTASSNPPEVCQEWSYQNACTTVPSGYWPAGSGAQAGDTYACCY